MAASVESPPPRFDIEVETLIVGGGACGMVAALAAREAGQDVLVVEADPVAIGSTSLSAGLIPAADTQAQAAAGIADTAEIFANDIRTKAKGENDPALEIALAKGSAKVIDWLQDQHGFDFSVVQDFTYPGHSQHRMHGLPSRSGRELMEKLRSTCEGQGIDIVGNLRGTTLYADDRVRGLGATGPDGQRQSVGSRKLILACNGFGGNRKMVASHMPAIQDAVWFGHDGNRGEAVAWGDALGAATRHLGAYQGHGNVAQPHGILITWATMTEGGVQVNQLGERFWDESQGYSEAAQAVLAQPGGIAFAVFDERIAAVARQFADFRQAEATGAVLRAEDITGLADMIHVPAEALVDTVSTIALGQPDRFGRVFTRQLKPPYCAVRVTGALFHTQGGLVTDGEGRVLRPDGSAITGLFAGGGAACGVSGAGDTGYLSGNGLLAAVVLGHNAGRAKVTP